MTTYGLKSLFGMDRRDELLILVGKVSLIIFVVEFAIMVGFDLLEPTFGPEIASVVDSVLLTVIASPIIYFAVAQPFVLAARDATHKLEAQLHHSSALLTKNIELQNSLREASESIALAHDHVLQKVGADLHDGPAQLLSYCLLRLDSFAELARKVGFADDDLERLRGVLSDTMREVRAISKGLSLPQLSDLSLEETVTLAISSQGQMDIALVYDFDVDPRVPVSPSQKVCVYRIVQESIANARKHSGATKITVSVRSADKLSITIKDDGHGFERGAVREGLGINGMKARVNALGGQLDIQSRVPGGTFVSAVLPQS